MKLIDAIRLLGVAGSESTIYARPPSTPASDAEFASEGSDEERRLKAAGLRYFLEASIALEFVNDWRRSQEPTPTDNDSCERLIGYATNDA